jgi:AcrR family transcriptional regulator
MNKPRGRPRGGSDARSRLLAAARRRFLEAGYPGTTLRAVAADADVDVALVSYYFGSKQGLFAAAMTLAISPSAVLDTVLAGNTDALPERLTAAVIRTWDDPDLGGPLKALVAVAVQDPSVMRVLREFVEREVLARLAERLGGSQATARAAVVLTSVAGVIFTRHVLALAPVTEMPAAELASRLAPSVRVAMAGRRVPR